MIKEFTDLKYKIVFVIGGSGIIGESMAESLSRAEMKVALTYRTGDAAIEKTEALIKSGMQSMAIKVDVLDEESVKTSMKKVLKKWGRIDILVNAAGGHVPGTVIPPEKSVFNATLDGIKKVMDPNLFGTVIPTLVIGREMVK